MQSIGADSPLDGYVGRIADYVAGRTGRHVHITNLSDGGTTSDVVRRQRPQADLEGADLVIVADSNDLQQRVPVERYAVDLQRLIEAVPADRTVFSDLPIWPGRGRSQAVLERATSARGVQRADFARAFGRHRRWMSFPGCHPT